MEQPQANDVILGGQTPPPIASAILGGIVGLQQQLTMASSEQRSLLLGTALNYGEAGIDLLITKLNSDPVLLVRVTAYQLLQSVDSEKTNTAIANGILLNPGDKIYCVLESAITYGDDWYSLLDYVPNSGYWVKENFDQSFYTGEPEIFTDYAPNCGQAVSETDTLNYYDYYQSLEIGFSLQDKNYVEPIFDADGFVYINLEQAESEEQFTHYYEMEDESEPDWDWFEEKLDACYIPKLISRHIFKKTAELLAEVLHQELIMSKETPAIYNFGGYPDNFRDWCQENKISLLMNNTNRIYDLDEVTDFLKISKNYQLLGKLWRDLLGNLAFVHEEIVQQPTYLLIRGKL